MSVETVSSSGTCRVDIQFYSSTMFSLSYVPLDGCHYKQIANFIRLFFNSPHNQVYVYIGQNILLGIFYQKNILLGIMTIP